MNDKDQLQKELESVEAELKQALEDSLGIVDPYVISLRRQAEELKSQINAPPQGWVM